MKLLLVGTGGYAVNYIRTLLESSDTDLCWEGAVDPYFAVCPVKDRIEAAGIPVYDTMEEFYARHSADLAMICTPTFLHAEQSIFAMAHGSHVLCEKPLAPTGDEGLRMLEAEEKYGKFLAVGYQWSYSETMQALKADILSGIFGAPKLLKTAISWPRNRAYYARGGGWGGKLRRNGKLLLDSIAANACAHYLHNMLFLLGDAMDTSADFQNLQAECWRANDIENFDTCSILCSTPSGAKLCFIASHAAGINRDPIFEYAFEKGTVRFAAGNGAHVTAELTDGSTKDYGDPFADAFGKIRICAHAAAEGGRPICTAKTALPHAMLIQKLYETVPIRSFAEARIHPEDDAVVVPGLFDALYEAYDKVQLFSETGSGIFR